MAKFYGKIGFSQTIKTAPGVYTPDIVEKDYYGDVLRLSNKWRTSDEINDDLTINHKISIVYDLFASANLQTIAYVVWNNTKWKVKSAEINTPRLVLTLGGVYNG